MVPPMLWRKLYTLLTVDPKVTPCAATVGKFLPRLHCSTVLGKSTAPMLAWPVRPALPPTMRVIRLRHRPTSHSRFRIWELLFLGPEPTWLSLALLGCDDMLVRLGIDW